MLRVYLKLSQVVRAFVLPLATLRYKIARLLLKRVCESCLEAIDLPVVLFIDALGLLQHGSLLVLGLLAFSLQIFSQRKSLGMILLAFISQLRVLLCEFLLLFKESLNVVLHLAFLSFLL